MKWLFPFQLNKTEYAYSYRITIGEVSTELVYQLKKCPAESGKDRKRQPVVLQQQMKYIFDDG